MLHSVSVTVPALMSPAFAQSMIGPSRLQWARPGEALQGLILQAHRDMLNEIGADGFRIGDLRLRSIALAEGACEEFGLPSGGLVRDLSALADGAIMAVINEADSALSSSVDGAPLFQLSFLSPEATGGVPRAVLELSRVYARDYAVLRPDVIHEYTAPRPEVAWSSDGEMVNLLYRVETDHDIPVSFFSTVAQQWPGVAVQIRAYASGEDMTLPVSEHFERALIAPEHDVEMDDALLLRVKKSLEAILFAVPDLPERALNAPSECVDTFSPAELFSRSMVQAELDLIPVAEAKHRQSIKF